MASDPLLCLNLLEGFMWYILIGSLRFLQCPVGGRVYFFDLLSTMSSFVYWLVLVSPFGLITGSPQ